MVGSAGMITYDLNCHQAARGSEEEHHREGNTQQRAIRHPDGTRWICAQPRREESVINVVQLRPPRLVTDHDHRREKRNVPDRHRRDQGAVPVGITLEELNEALAAAGMRCPSACDASSAFTRVLDAL